MPVQVILPVLMCIVCGGLCAPSFNVSQSAGAATFKRATSAGRETPVTFVGTVKSIEMLGRRKLSVIPVDFDSRFALTLHVESVRPQEAPFEEGTELVFGIHSPARLFHGGKADAIGKKYRFKVVWENAGDRSRFSALTAGPMEGE